MGNWWKKQQAKQQQKPAAEIVGTGDYAGPVCPVCGAINCDRHQQQPSVKKISASE